MDPGDDSVVKNIGGGDLETPRRDGDGLKMKTKLRRSTKLWRGGGDLMTSMTGPRPSLGCRLDAGKRKGDAGRQPEEINPKSNSKSKLQTSL